MKEITLDCRGLCPRSALHRAFAEALSFPDHYGNNLDALHDCLTAIPEDTRITLVNWSAAGENLGRYAAALHRVLTDCAAENPHLCIIFQ